MDLDGLRTCLRLVDDDVLEDLFMTCGEEMDRRGILVEEDEPGNELDEIEDEEGFDDFTTRPEDERA